MNETRAASTEPIEFDDSDESLAFVDLLAEVEARNAARETQAS